jgi:hypothetical protein
MIIHSPETLETILSDRRHLAGTIEPYSGAHINDDP